MAGHIGSHVRRQGTMVGSLSRNWWAFVLRGIVAIALGVLAFASPGATLVALIAVFAAFAIFDGILAIAAGISVDGGPRWMFILGGILGIVIGVLTINRPDITAVALVLLIGVWAIATGVAEAVAAYSFREVLENEWLLALSGIVSVAFGALLIFAPGDGVLALLWLIGFYAILAGILYIAAGLRLRSVHEKLQPLEKAMGGAGQQTASNPRASAGS
jgi:uncharacterized membrane protein HdeD (DUF308 family)